MSPLADKLAALEPTSAVELLKGCGVGLAERLARLGIRTIRDLLFFFPRDYEDLTQLVTIERLEEGQPASVLATVDEVELRERGLGRSVVGVLARQGDLFLRALWFNQPFQARRFRAGQNVLLSGRPKYHGNRWQMSHPQVKVIEAEGPPPAGQILPLYPLTEGLRQPALRTLMRTALAACGTMLDEVFPPDYLRAHQLLPLAEALPQLHFPESLASLEQARRRFVYQELLVLQLALALRRGQIDAGPAALALPASAKIDARIRRRFPFELTPGQEQAIAEIAADMARTQPMNRLLQGDVGSGKTVVAVYALLLAVAHGAQAALMAPTELLVRQHAQTLAALLAGSQVRMAVLSGAASARERTEILAGLAAGDVHVVLGTQALVEEEVVFKRLALVVVDEQHKFGVRQRAALGQVEHQPHCLLMTATPIPRTVALALYGDLEVSTLRDRPPGRQQVHTYLPPSEDWPRWWEFFRKKLAEGRQGYVITPLVDGGDDGTGTSLEESFEVLANGELEAFRLGLVHGRLSSERKQAALEAFRRGDTQVLVATSVVEVGVDVPNATLMTIHGAERFGLAQLHQLRGRVNRGVWPGYCCLLTTAAKGESRQRLEALVASQDGFELSEIDFQLRGPGELLGTRQHGLPPLRVADLARDRDQLDEARRDAQALLVADPALERPEHARLLKMVLGRYGRTLELGSVG